MQCWIVATIIVIAEVIRKDCDMALLCACVWMDIGGGMGECECLRAAGEAPSIQIPPETQACSGC